LIWVTGVSFCCFISIYLILSSWIKFYDDPTIISVSIRPPDETFYVIAVTVCKSNIYNETKLQQTIKRIWGVEPKMDTYSYYKHLITNITNFSYKRIKEFSHYKENVTLLMGEDFNNLTMEVSFTILTANYCFVLLTTCEVLFLYRSQNFKIYNYVYY
ncbi:hypothetical protein C0J52_16430, partial [Blattella germanica]